MLTGRCNLCLHSGLMLAALVVALAGTGSAAADAADAKGRTTPPQFPDQQHVAELIEALGNPRYVVRRAAEQQLLGIGMKAFDQIDAATDNPDPEIAASCRYLVSELTVRWTRREDPPQVKLLLDDYATHDYQGRMRVVELLGTGIDRWGVGPLCRICRYDQSPEVARQAAIELLRSEQLDSSYPPETARQLRAELGTSVRQPAHWLRLLALQIESPRSAIEPWSEAIEQATADRSGSADDELLAAQADVLLENLARLQLRSGNSPEFLAAIDQLLARSPGPVVAKLGRFIDWALAGDSPKLVDEMIDRYAPRLERSKAGLYLMAMARAEQGQADAAQQLADRAFDRAVSPEGDNSPTERLLQADMLMDHGQVEWARRELRASMDEATVGTPIHSLACFALAESLHDWQRHEQAADVLAELTEALKADATLLKQYNDRVQRGAHVETVRRRLFSLSELESYQMYYQSRQAKAADDRQREWDLLERALKLDPTNADFMIAMYRASEPGSQRRADVVEAIESRCRELEQLIDNAPNYAQSYNEWAWLVSNTEGDFRKAIRYSQKSLDLFAELGQPKEESAGLLDTLGRCYFAAGDYESAVKYQTLAVEYKPHMQVLQRQLDEFEQALAAEK